MGPSAIRYAGLSEKLEALGRKVVDRGNIETPIAEAISVEQPKAKYLSNVKQVCLRLAKEVTSSVRRKEIPLVLGGDHSIAIGTLAGIHNGLTGSGGEENFGVIWLDAHGDFNTPEISPSGNIHGMSLAFASGQGTKWFPPPWPKRSVDPKRITIVGARQLDPKEQKNLQKMGVKVLSMSDIDRSGMKSIMTEAIETTSDGGRNQIHVSLDMDLVDPSDAPGVGTPVRGGTTYREAHLAMEMVYESRLMRSLEVVEVNPILDQQNATAELAVELILSAMGKRII